MNLIGQVINGYKILNYINDGGFGVVYKAEKGGVYYAIKIFKEAYVLREYRKGADNRIQREIDIIKSVKHANLVSYVENFTQDIDGSPHHLLVMEYVEGTNLRDKLNKETKLSEEESIAIFHELLNGIEALHQTSVDNNGSTGVIHRDLKPENILIDGAGNIKIVDYGLSKIIDYTSITSTGEIFGTGPYMSPEQITDSKHIDRRSDLYTLGIILYELLTGEFPYDFQSEPELIDKIKNEPPIPPRRKVPEISNVIENIILKLLEKSAYERFVSVQQIRESISEREVLLTPKPYDLKPRFVLRLYDDKTTLENFLPRMEYPLAVEFPANLKTRQAGLLKVISSGKTVKMIDPATMRLTYDTYADNEGLKALPYARPDFQPITVEYLKDYKKQKEYVKSVIDEELSLGADILLSPFHYTHNSNVSLTTTNTHAEWFDLDIKLLKEAIDYKNSREDSKNKEIYAGICIHQSAINDERERKHILNTYSLFDCDGYLFYVDCIDDETSRATLLNYIKLLRDLQEKTGKPVIAGRVGSIGLGLLCAGISGYSSGTARFESFYEDLYKEAGPAYNMYERYYYPQLLTTIPILRKDPAKFEEINEVLGVCACDFCAGKDTAQTLVSANTKLHFLEMITGEVKTIYEMPKEDRVSYFLKRIDEAIDNYSALTPTVFKPSDYAHLLAWRDVFLQLK